jgi:hypothetical protein
MEDYLSTRDAVEAVESAAPSLAPVVLVDPPPPSLRLYLRRNWIVGQPLPEALANNTARDGLTYLAFAPRRERWVARMAGAPLEILLRTPSLVVARVRPELPIP